MARKTTFNPKYQIPQGWQPKKGFVPGGDNNYSNLRNAFNSWNAGSGTEANASAFEPLGGDYDAFAGANVKSTLNNTIPGDEYDNLAGLGFDIFGNLFDPALGANLQGILSPKFNYNLQTGLSGWGHNLGGAATALNAGYQGLQAIQGIGNLNDTVESNEDLVSKILSSSSSPYLQYDLTSDQLDLLTDLKRKGYDDSFDLSSIDLMDLLGGAGQGLLMGIPGGLPGMLTGAIGGGVNAAIGGASESAEADNAELMALYNAVMQSEQQYKNMLRQRAYQTF